MQALELIINDKEIYFINIYGPNNDDCNFFEQLEKYLKENDEKTLSSQMSHYVTIASALEFTYSVTDLRRAVAWKMICTEYCLPLWY